MIFKDKNQKNKSNKKSELKITTFDNPFSPFTQFDEWYTYDTRYGYDTLGLLSRMAMSSSQLSEADQKRIYEDSMIQLVRLFPDVYKIVIEKDYK